MKTQIESLELQISQLADTIDIMRSPYMQIVNLQQYRETKAKLTEAITLYIDLAQGKTPQEAPNVNGEPPLQT